MLMMWSKDGPVRDVYVLYANDMTNGFPVLNNPHAQRLFSNDDQEYGMQMGGRLTFGLWADDARKWGFELSGFALEEGDASWDFGATGGTKVSLISYQDPGGFEQGFFGKAPFSTLYGTIDISSHSQLWGVEGLGLHNLKRDDSMSLDVSFGVKHVDLSEDFRTSFVDVYPAFSFTAKDKWEATNQFFGAKIGMKFNMTCWDRLLVNIEPGVSIGANCESLRISGSSLAAGTVHAGGAFTGPTNMGTYDKTHFSVAPEIKLGLGCKITKKLSFNANYNFIYLSDVVRPGEQFNRQINPGAVGINGGDPNATPRRPTARFDTTDYWAHGVGVNLKIKF
jgi:hypothetical protein